MSKVKPVLIFIIASIALHWWILSLPIFKRIQVRDGDIVKPASPTVMAYLKKADPSLDPPEKTAPTPQSVGDSNAENLKKNFQQPLSPSFLRGSPWSRRSLEGFSGNTTGPRLTPNFTQVEMRLQNEFPLNQPIDLECKRSGIERLFICQGGNEIPAEKIANVLNQQTTSPIYLPDCIAFEAQQKKWHAKACHS